MRRGAGTTLQGSSGDGTESHRADDGGGDRGAWPGPRPGPGRADRSGPGRRQQHPPGRRGGLCPKADRAADRAPAAGTAAGGLQRHRAEPCRAADARQGAVLGHAGGQRQPPGLCELPLPRRCRHTHRQPAQPGHQHAAGRRQQLRQCGRQDRQRRRGGRELRPLAGRLSVPPIGERRRPRVARSVRHQRRHVLAGRLPGQPDNIR